MVERNDVYAQLDSLKNYFQCGVEIVKQLRNGLDVTASEVTTLESLNRLQQTFEAFEHDATRNAEVSKKLHYSYLVVLHVKYRELRNLHRNKDSADSAHPLTCDVCCATDTCTATATPLDKIEWMSTPHQTPNF